MTFICEAVRSVAPNVACTAVNVAGQALVAVIVAKRSGLLDERAFASAEARGLPDLVAG